MPVWRRRHVIQMLHLSPKHTPSGVGYTTFFHLQNNFNSQLKLSGSRVCPLSPGSNPLRDSESASLLLHPTQSLAEADSWLTTENINEETKVSDPEGLVSQEKTLFPAPTAPLSNIPSVALSHCLEPLHRSLGWGWCENKQGGTKTSCVSKP